MNTRNNNQTTKSKGLATVTLYPHGDQIKFHVDGKIFNRESGEMVPNSKTLDQDDPIWNLVFGGKRGTKRFLKSKKTVKKALSIATLGYENCDLRN